MARRELTSGALVRAVIAAVALGLILTAIWLAYEPVPTDPLSPPDRQYPDITCPALLPDPGASLCPVAMAERAVHVSALFAVGVLGLFAAARVPRLDTDGWLRRLPWSVAAGAIVPILALIGIRFAQQANDFVTGVPLAVLVPGVLVVVAGCVSLVRPVWPTLALGLAIGLAEAVPLTILIHLVWKRFGS